MGSACTKETPKTVQPVAPTPNVRSQAQGQAPQVTTNQTSSPQKGLTPRQQTNPQTQKNVPTDNSRRLDQTGVNDDNVVDDDDSRIHSPPLPPVKHSGAIPSVGSLGYNGQQQSGQLIAPIPTSQSPQNSARGNQPTQQQQGAASPGRQSNQTNPSGMPQQVSPGLEVTSPGRDPQFSQRQGQQPTQFQRDPSPRDLHEVQPTFDVQSPKDRKGMVQVPSGAGMPNQASFGGDQQGQRQSTQQLPPNMTSSQVGGERLERQGRSDLSKSLVQSPQSSQGGMQQQPTDGKLMRSQNGLPRQGQAGQAQGSPNGVRGSGAQLDQIHEDAHEGHHELSDSESKTSGKFVEAQNASQGYYAAGPGAKPTGSVRQSGDVGSPSMRKGADSREQLLQLQQNQKLQQVQLLEHQGSGKILPSQQDPLIKSSQMGSNGSLKQGTMAQASFGPKQSEAPSQVFAANNSSVVMGRKQPPDDPRFSREDGLVFEPVVVKQMYKNKPPPKPDEPHFDSVDRFSFEKRMQPPPEPKDLQLPTGQQAEVTRQTFLAEVESQAHDPLFMRLNVVFLLDGPDGLGRRLYYFYSRKVIGTLLDLKRTLTEEFGYALQNQIFYYNFVELPETTIFSNIQNFQNETENVYFLSVRGPENPPLQHFREKIKEPKIDDLKAINCSEINMQDYLMHVNLEENLSFPPYRDWTTESSTLFRRIREFALQVLSNVETIENKEMSSLMNTEIELRRLLEEFVHVAQKVVHSIVQYKIAPLAANDLDNLYGRGGRKYIIGGLLVRECSNWYYAGHCMGEGDVNNKLADKELRNANLLRGKYENYELPISTVIEYYGTRYYVQALSAISQRGLLHGSNTEGILIANNGTEVPFAEKLATDFNLAPHSIVDRVDMQVKPLLLPYDLEIYQDDSSVAPGQPTPRDLRGMKPRYILNTLRLMPPLVEDVFDISTYDGSTLRPEYVVGYNDGQLKEGYRYFTWIDPKQCDECEQFIDDYEYYYFEKRNVDKAQTLLRTYYCCLRCYQTLIPTKRFKVPENRIQKKVLPVKERAKYWMNVETRHKVFDKPPCHEVSLNPDAFIHFSEYDQRGIEEHFFKELETSRITIQRATLNLIDNVLPKFIAELNSMELLIRTSEELTDHMHQRGINMKFLGKISLECRHNYMRELIVREILARSIKVLVRDGLSFLKDEPNGFTLDDVKKCILHYLNEIFGARNQHGSKANSIWEFLSELIKKKFEIAMDHDILQKVNLPILLRTCATKLGFRLADYNKFDLTNQDVVFIAPKVKAKNNYKTCVDIALERARLIDKIGKRSQWFMEGGPERIVATEMFRTATIMMEQIFGEEIGETAKVYKEFAEHLEDRHQEKGKPQYSLWNKCAFVAENELSAEARFYYQKAINAYTKTGDEMNPAIAECYTACARLVKEKNFTQGNFSETESPEVFAHLYKAIECVEHGIGVEHPETAELYTKLALAYQERGLIVDASPWIRRAFCMFKRIFGTEDEITLKTFEYLKAIEVVVDSGLEHIPIEHLAEAIEKMEFESRNQLALPSSGVGFMPQSSGGIMLKSSQSAKHNSSIITQAIMNPQNMKGKVGAAVRV